MTSLMWTDLDLEPQHRTLLQDSGLNPEVAADRGYRSARASEDVPEQFSPSQRKLVPSLVIPVYGVDETPEPITFELRPDNPRADGRGKGGQPRLRKYEFPANAPKRLDVPRRVRPMLGDPSVALWITEGARKADAAAGIGLAAVSLAGVWAFRSSNVDGGKVELPDFDRVAFNERHVNVAFDSDVIVKPQVRRALHRLAGVLMRRGARVHVVVLPSGPSGAKMGLDDFIAGSAGEKELLNLIDEDFLADDSRSVEQRLFHFIRDSYELGQDNSGNGFAIPRGGPRVVRMLQMGRPSLELEAPARFYRADPEHPIVSRRVIRDVIGLVEAECLLAPRQELHLRTAPCGNGLVVDLGDTTGTVVAVGPTGWKVATRPPDHFPLFRRTSTVAPLPSPRRGGSLEELRDLLNVTEETWPLVKGWLIASVFGWVARPWLMHIGPQGSGKSDAALLLLNVLDHREALSVAPRKNDRGDPSADAAGSYLLGYDNLSTISADFSDWLCSLITGAIDKRRVLMTTSTMVSLSFMRTGIITSITPSGLRPDLLERLVTVEFGRIAGESRRQHSEVMALFRRGHGRMLGALLDAVSLVLANLDKVDVRALRVPRMTDYAAVLRAYDLGAGTDLFGAYSANVGDSMTDAADEDPVAAVVLSYMAHRKTSVEMEPGQLYSLLSVHRLGMNLSEDAYWPRDAKGLSGALLRMSAVVEGHVRITRRRLNTKRFIKIELVTGDDDPTPEPPSSPHRHPPSSPPFSQVRTPINLLSDDSDDDFPGFVKGTNTKNVQDPRFIFYFPEAPECIVTIVTSVTDPELSASGPATEADHGPSMADTGKLQTCSVCRSQMVVTEPGQTTHPCCDPLVTADMDSDQRETYALSLLAGELGATGPEQPTVAPWVSTVARQRLAQRRKAEADARAIGLPGRLTAATVGSVSARVYWEAGSARQALSDDRRRQVHELALRFSARHQDAHRSASQAPPVATSDTVLVVISRSDLELFLTELVIAMVGAP